MFWPAASSVLWALAWPLKDQIKLYIPEDIKINFCLTTKIWLCWFFLRFFHFCCFCLRESCGCQSSGTLFKLHNQCHVNSSAQRELIYGKVFSLFVDFILVLLRSIIGLKDNLYRTYFPQLWHLIRHYAEECIFPNLVLAADIFVCEGVGNAGVGCLKRERGLTLVLEDTGQVFKVQLQLPGSH